MERHRDDEIGVGEEFGAGLGEPAREQGEALVPVTIFEALDKLAHGVRIMRRCSRAVVNWGRGDGSCREPLLARLERKRNPEPLAERRRDEIDLGETGPAEKPVAADARAARDADGRQKEVGNAPQQPRRGAGPFRRDCGFCPPLKAKLCFAGRHGRHDRTGGAPAQSLAMTDERLLFDRKLLRARRGRFAHEVAAHELLLAHVAREIAERVALMLRPFPLALDLGAYHGLLGQSVAQLPSVGATIYAESVFELADLCPRPALVCDEDLLPFREASLNLIVSGLALHRVNDLPGALIQIRRALAPDGLFMAAALGAGALIELRRALLEAEDETQGGASPRVAPFGDVRDYGALLQRAGFALPVADAETLTVVYANPRELMREIRALGGGNVLLARTRRPLQRKTLERAEALYCERHALSDGGVRATFEIVYLTGWGPDPSQQKPLKPGSAARRLADALGTKEQPAADKTPYPTRRLDTH